MISDDGVINSPEKPFTNYEELKDTTAERSILSLPEAQAPLTYYDYVNALMAQEACNLSGIVHEFSRVMHRIWGECNRCGKNGTDYVNRHPIARLYAEQISHLSGAGCSTEIILWQAAAEYCWRHALNAGSKECEIPTHEVNKSSGLDTNVQQFADWKDALSTYLKWAAPVYINWEQFYAMEVGDRIAPDGEIIKHQSQPVSTGNLQP